MARPDPEAVAQEAAEPGLDRFEQDGVAGRVHADGLKRTARRSIDGDIGPGWWNSQSIDPSPILATGFCVARGSVTKASPRRSESTNALLL